MAREFRLRKSPWSPEGEAETGQVLDRRQFIRYSFNSAAGVITAISLGAIGFASLLMGESGGGGGDSEIRFWVPKGSEDSVWYGDQHLESMTESGFKDEAGRSTTGMSGASGVWSGLPVNVVYIPHEENKNLPPMQNKPRIQFMDGVDQTGAIIGYGGDMEEDPAYAALKVSNNILVIFGRCPHLCCIPGWQLIENNFTADNWEPGGLDSGGNKLFCICHSSRYDPTVVEMNTNRNRASGTVFQYFGIKRTGGPTPVGMPLIPFTVNNDVIEVVDFKAEGIEAMLDWYTYCD